ncbi:MAG: hypothetical protein ACPL7B_09650 [Candidatus Poribacteria bacterium]
MKSYFVFKIQGDSDVIEPIGKFNASTADEAIKSVYRTYKKEWFDDDFALNDDWTFESALKDGNITGGEDSAIFGYLPEMEDSWIITSETGYAVMAVEETQLMSAMLKAICEMKR